ncbi:MAG: 50S ribosomal protein L29 [Thermomicrobiales bacterium]|nr:50S ribosomal protein L29 [Thermomicrobiales bacterium]
MKASEIRAMSGDQMDQTLTDLHTEWRNLRFQEAVGQLTATARIGQIRRDIARIHTVRTEREIDAALTALVEASAE